MFSVLRTLLARFWFCGTWTWINEKVYKIEEFRPDNRHRSSIQYRTFNLNFLTHSFLISIHSISSFSLSPLLHFIIFDNFPNGFTMWTNGASTPLLLLLLDDSTFCIIEWTISLLTRKLLATLHECASVFFNDGEINSIFVCAHYNYNNDNDENDSRGAHMFGNMEG